MVATKASRVALSCEPTSISTFSSSMRRTADFVDSAGGPPASVGISLIWRPMNAAGLVDLFGGELGARFLRRPEQRCRAAQRDEQADLEFIGGGRGRAAQPGRRTPRRPRRRREACAACGHLLPNAHVDVSLVFSSYYRGQGALRRRQFGQQTARSRRRSRAASWSLPRGRESSMPTGSPALVIPAGRLMPGNPADAARDWYCG